MKNMRKKLLSRLFYNYLKLLEKTVKIKWISPETFPGNGVVGFWHEDSFIMNLILKMITEHGNKVSVLVTEDSRGDYIQYVLEKCNGDAVRIGYGFCNAGVLRDLLNALKDPNRSVAIAMDGPLGPRQIPKKMPSFLSEKSNTPLTQVTLTYSHKLRLKHRWDHYRIPLPFSTICVQCATRGRG